MSEELLDPVDAILPAGDVVELPGSERGSGLQSIKDNLEAFAVAIVIALVIKHFCVEAFKIPTSSMRPTLFGDDSEHTGDRILVDKLAYLTGGPERWDVIVFRYPLDKSRNFIKRVAGLPGERIRIVRGDVWVLPPGKSEWRIADKAPLQREQLYFSVYPPTWEGAASESEKEWLAHTWKSEGAGSWRAESRALFEYAGGGAATLVYEPRIGSDARAADRYDGGSTLAHDVRLRARVTPTGPASISFTWRADGDRVCETRLSSAGFGEPSGAAVKSTGQTRAEARLDLLLQTGKPTDLVLEAIDGEWIVVVDGRQVARLSQGRTPDEAGDYGASGQRLSITAEGAPLRVEGFRIDRDLWYMETGMSEIDPEGDGLLIPEDSWFMLGDNTTGSSDSRRWRRTRLALQDGREISWDGSESSSAPHPSVWSPGDDGRPPAALLAREGTIWHVTDVDGVERWWLKEDEDSAKGRNSAPTPFVHRDLVVGRAFFVFWPLVPGFPGRLQLIH